MFVERGDHPSSELSRILPIVCNTSDDVIRKHIESALKYPVVKPVPPHDVPAIIVGGGPSARDELATMEKLGAGTVFALNGAGLWLQSVGVTPHALIMMDARAHNARFITGLDPRVKLYLATQCHPDVFAAAEANGNPIIAWHAANCEEGVEDIVETRDTVIIGYGTSVGIRALRLVHVLGFRTVHLFGYDSSFKWDRDQKDWSMSHAYPQSENEGDEPRGCQVGGRWFVSTGWMIRQAEDFQNLCNALMVEGMDFHVHGDGLLPAMAREMGKEPREENPSAISDTAKIHPYAHVDDTVKIGARTRVWQFASVIRGTVLGEDCNVASGALLDGPRFGDRCIICQNVAMGPGFLFGNDCFIGPNVTICNDAFPVTSKEGFDVERFRGGFWTVVVKDGASIGANAVVLPGVTIGAGAMIAAGAVVDRSVPDRMLFTRDGKLRALPDRLPPRMRAAQ